MAKKIANIIIFILIIIVIILLYTFVESNILKKDYVNIFGYTVFQVETGSMTPTIKIDDIVVIKLGTEINQDDIITYKKDENFVTHRVVKIDGQEITAKGDNNNVEDEIIEKSQVIGKVVYTIKNVGVWKKVFTNVKVIISISLTIILFILVIAYKEKDKEGSK